MERTRYILLWLEDTPRRSCLATKNNGRISRKAYMDEMGRRWDAMDRNQQGLTPAEVSRIYGNVDSAAGPARSGAEFVLAGDRSDRRLVGRAIRLGPDS